MVLVTLLVLGRVSCLPPHVTLLTLPALLGPPARSACRHGLMPWVRLVNLSPTEDLLLLTTRGRRLRNLVTIMLVQLSMTVATTDGHPGSTLTLELNRRPPGGAGSVLHPEW